MTNHSRIWMKLWSKWPAIHDSFLFLNHISETLETLNIVSSCYSAHTVKFGVNPLTIKVFMSDLNSPIDFNPIAWNTHNPWNESAMDLWCPRSEGVRGSSPQKSGRQGSSSLQFPGALIFRAPGTLDFQGHTALIFRATGTLDFQGYRALIFRATGTKAPGALIFRALGPWNRDTFPRKILAASYQF